MDFLRQLPLVDINEHHQLHKAVVNDFSAMQKAAREDGVDMEIASSYRSIERQLFIWNNKWLGNRPLFDREGKQLDCSSLTDEEKLNAILIWSALPGASRHHWGTDIDVYDAKAIEASGQKLQLVEAEYVNGGPCIALSKWMDDNLSAFGFYRPYQTDTGGVAVEPWHISHLAQSQRIENSLSKSDFETLLKQIDIQGRATIINNLDWIWDCYVLNKGRA